jgi:hypothetical protein
MTADLTRDTFNPAKHFVRVVMQQGRVQLDSDWNEQAAILLHYVQCLAADLIGPHGGPGNGFAISAATDTTNAPFNFTVAAGHYYADGVLCENEADLTYDAQPGYPFEGMASIAKSVQALVYLDVWERHVTAVEDDSIREVALDGPDTTSRSQVVWQARVLGLDSESTMSQLVDNLTHARTNLGNAEQKNSISEIRLVRDAIATAELAIVTNLDDLFGRNAYGLPYLRARARQPSTGTAEPCVIPPDAKYRGPENQLYRLQIHTGGQLGTATFKWSRENASVIFPVLRAEGKVLALQHLGRDRRSGLQPGDWVEVEDDDYVLQGVVAPLRQVQAVDDDNMTVTLDQAPGFAVSLDKHPVARRWDHGRADPSRPGAELAGDGAVKLTDGIGETGWIDLEDGVQAQFQGFTTASVPTYKTGDYWLIPARTATADVEWPQDTGATPGPGPAPQPPRGIHHHYAPLARLMFDSGQHIAGVDSLRRTIPSLAAIFS